MAQEKYRKRPSNTDGTRKNTPSGGLSPEEKQNRARKKREAERRRLQEKQRQREMRRVRRKKLFVLSFALALVFVLLYWCGIALLIANRSDGREEALPLLIFTEGERKEDARIEPEECYFSDHYYLPITFLESYTTISQFGDYQTRSVLIGGTGEYATFYLGTSEAVVNGRKVSLEENVFLKDDVLYLPVDFFTNKMNGFQFTTSSALAAVVLTYQPTEELSFGFYSTPPSETVSFDTVPVAPTVPDPEAPTAPE